MTKPIIPYVGGKTRLLKRILPLIPEHTTYVEPFCGGAAVLFSKEQSKCEVINDINGDLVNLYRVVQHHLEEFVKQFKYCLVSRETFHLEKKKCPDTLTDIQRAARTFYLQKNAFGGKVEGQTFGIAKTQPPRMNLLRIEEELSAAHLRLSWVLIENLPWIDCVQRFDKPETFFFGDPPYWETEGYGVDFEWKQYEQLLETLKTIKGRMLITLNDHPEIRELFKGYIIDTASIKYAVSSTQRSKASKELFIANYTPESC